MISIIDLYKVLMIKLNRFSITFIDLDNLQKIHNLQLIQLIPFRMFLTVLSKILRLLKKKP